MRRLLPLLWVLAPLPCWAGDKPTPAPPQGGADKPAHLASIPRETTDMLDACPRTFRGQAGAPGWLNEKVVAQVNSVGSRPDPKVVRELIEAGKASPGTGKIFAQATLPADRTQPARAPHLKIWSRVKEPFAVVQFQLDGPAETQPYVHLFEKTPAGGWRFVCITEAIYDEPPNESEE